MCQKSLHLVEGMSTSKILKEVTGCPHKLAVMGESGNYKML